MHAFDEFELHLSQSVPVVASQSRGLPSEDIGLGDDLMDGNDGLGGGGIGNGQGARIDAASKFIC